MTDFHIYEGYDRLYCTVRYQNHSAYDLVESKDNAIPTNSEVETPDMFWGEYESYETSGAVHTANRTIRLKCAGNDLTYFYSDIILTFDEDGSLSNFENTDMVLEDEGVLAAICPGDIVWENDAITITVKELKIDVEYENLIVGVKVENNSNQTIQLTQGDRVITVEAAKEESYYTDYKHDSELLAIQEDGSALLTPAPFEITDETGNPLGTLTFEELIPASLMNFWDQTSGLVKFDDTQVTADDWITITLTDIGGAEPNVAATAKIENTGGKNLLIASSPRRANDNGGVLTETDETTLTLTEKSLTSGSEYTFYVFDEDAVSEYGKDEHGYWYERSGRKYTIQFSASDGVNVSCSYEETTEFAYVR